MSYDYIKRMYGLSFIVNQRVLHTVTKGLGSVCREDKSQGHYVMVRFDGKKHALPCHPQELKKVQP